ncbi:MAG: histidine kinase N-terminal 7TM domain-containing protein, partial [Acidobacteriota bacterium]
MAWQNTPYDLPLIVSVVICLLVGLLAWRRRPRPGGTALALLMVAVAFWSGGYALELSSAELGRKILWAKIQYFGILAVPISALSFSLLYSGRVKRVGPRFLTLLAIEPLLTLVLLWNPTTSSLMWSEMRLDLSRSFSVLDLTYGPWFWVNATYSYGLYLLASAYLVGALARSPRLYRKQGAAVVVAIFAPWVGNALYISGFSPVAHVDPTPFAFSFTGLALFFGLVRLQFLDIMPLARTAVLEAMRDGVIVLDPECRIVDLNPAAERMLGVGGAEAVGRPIGFVLPAQAELAEQFGAGGEVNAEIVLPGGDERRSPLSYDLRSWPLCDPGHGPSGRLIALRDISQQQQAEEALHASEERLRVMVEQMPAVLWATDTELKFTLSLGSGLEALDLSSQEVVGKSLYEFFDTHDPEYLPLAAHLRALEGEASTYKFEWVERSFECHVEPLYGSGGEVIGAIGVALDMTETEILQDQLRQAQKMEAIGRMAGGVAHDFNNLLTAVAGYAQLAQEDLELSRKRPGAIHNLGKDIDAIEVAAKRATSLTGQLLAFSRRQVLQPKVLDLNEIVADMEKMLRRMTGGQIQLATQLGSGIHRLKADPVQMQQVIINLFLNSRDAMPQGGKVTIATATAVIDDTQRVRHDLIPAGHYVTLAVSDEGFGMDEITQAHL